MNSGLGSWMRGMEGVSTGFGSALSSLVVVSFQRTGDM